jgi:peptidoglycan/xylan/chitin deacetylase (PgdA/CDA1 family)
MGFAKHAFKRVIGLPGAAAFFRPLLRDCGVVFMLHRFAIPELGIVGDDPEWLRTCLGYFRRQRRELLSLTEMFERLAEGRSLRGAIAFTLDDGYREQVQVVGSVFAEFDCPATVFATTGFLDGALWFWWDKIDYVFANASKRSANVPLGDRGLAIDFSDMAQRDLNKALFIEACKRVPDHVKHNAIRELASQGEVDLPMQPPECYAPASWDQARQAEERGLTFGPHTVTHPILSRASDDQSSHEIEESWRRIQTELRNPVPVFCYPNGQSDDFGEREIGTLSRLGLAGAVIGIAGYARGRSFQASTNARFRVPRFAFPPEFVDVLQYASGVERMKQLVRAATA